MSTFHITFLARRGSCKTADWRKVRFADAPSPRELVEAHAALTDGPVVIAKARAPDGVFTTVRYLLPGDPWPRRGGWVSCHMADWYLP